MANVRPKNAGPNDSDDQVTGAPGVSRPQKTPAKPGAPSAFDPDATFAGDPDGTLAGDPEATFAGGPDETFAPPLDVTFAGGLSGTAGQPEGDDFATIGPTPVGSGDTHKGPIEVGQQFGRRYRIIRELGVGGMGAVYQAWDAELGVVVAVKVIRPEIASNPEASAEIERRFKRELLLARQVTHPNVVRIHDLGDINGIKYITMPFIEGSDLSTILNEHKLLPVPRALQIARGVVAGLVSAHEAGVVHRDLKPANIMIGADDVPTIMDFGIARSADSPQQAAVTPRGVRPSDLSRTAGLAASTTQAGAIVGTVAYMAPEQASGKPVDQRADVYAFGLILYDMLIGGRRREHAVSAIAELQERMQTPPPAPRTIDPQIPEAVDAIVRRCIEPDAGERFQTTVELQQALDRLDDNGALIPEKRVVGLRVFAGVIALALTLLGGTWYLYFSRPPAASVERAALPVLIANFDNRANEPLFDKTLEQALAIGVEGASFLTVYPARDAERVAARIKPGATLDEANARLVAVREGIKIVLAGVVASTGSGYSIEVKALQPDGKVVSTASTTATDKQDVLKQMGTLATRIRRALGDTAPPKPGEMESFTTTSLEAASLFSQARVHSAAYRDEEAIIYYKAAVGKDPNFGRAYAGWANGAFRLGRLEESGEAWKKALSLVDRMTEREKYRTLGLYYGTVSQNYAQAIENYKLLVKNYPSDGAGHNNLALAYFNTLNFPAALEESKRALQVTPTSLLYQGNSALFAMYASDFNSSATHARQIVEQNPSYHPAYFPLAIAAIVASKPSEATQAYEKMANANPAGRSVAHLGLADLAIYEGRFAEAVTILLPAIAEDETRKNRPGMVAKYSALADAYVGDRKLKQAREAALKAVELAGEDIIGVPAARGLASLGIEREVIALSQALGAKLQPQSRAYAEILKGEVALQQRKMVEAVEAFRAAQKLADLWLTHYGLGVAYVQAGQYPEALAEFELCQKRRGEGAALLLDDQPSIRYTATLSYWLGRAKEQMGMAPAAIDHYKAFLALRPNSPTDPLVLDAKKRAGITP